MTSDITPITAASKGGTTAQTALDIPGYVTMITPAEKRSIDALAEHAAEWLLTLTPQQARRKAGMTSKRFWLKSLLQDLWLPT